MKVFLKSTVKQNTTQMARLDYNNKKQNQFQIADVTQYITLNVLKMQEDRGGNYNLYSGLISQQDILHAHHVAVNTHF